ncbi:MAG: hypothetical protein H5T45_01525 [Thermoplasmatales archaeon]|nr:hypothetical protein [Thermoplasmatales archaeon]
MKIEIKKMQDDAYIMSIRDGTFFGRKEYVNIGKKAILKILNEIIEGKDYKILEEGKNAKSKTE